MENIIITVSEIPEVRTDLFIYDSIKDQYPELTRSKLKNLLKLNKWNLDCMQNLCDLLLIFFVNDQKL